MSRPLLLAQELFLLTHDDASGRSAGTTALANGLAGALLLDLALGGFVVDQGKDLVATDVVPEHPLLRAALGEIRASSRPRPAKHWVQRLPSALKELPAQVGRSLAEAGVLSEQRSKVWGIFPTTRWPEVDPAPERELRTRVHAVLVTGLQPDPRTAMCVSLLVPLGLVRGVVEKSERRPAEARAKEIAKSGLGSGVSAAVSSSVQAVNTAVMVAVMVPVMTTTTSS